MMMAVRVLVVCADDDGGARVGGAWAGGACARCADGDVCADGGR